MLNKGRHSSAKSVCSGHPSSIVSASSICTPEFSSVAGKGYEVNMESFVVIKDTCIFHKELKSV